MQTTTTPTKHTVQIKETVTQNGLKVHFKSPKPINVYQCLNPYCTTQNYAIKRLKVLGSPKNELIALLTQKP
jgi:hypothetical protein